MQTTRGPPGEAESKAEGDSAANCQTRRTGTRKDSGWSRIPSPCARLLRVCRRGASSRFTVGIAGDRSEACYRLLSERGAFKSSLSSCWRLWVQAVMPTLNGVIRMKAASIVGRATRVKVPSRVYARKAPFAPGFLRRMTCAHTHAKPARTVTTVSFAPWIVNAKAIAPHHALRTLRPGCASTVLNSIASTTRVPTISCVSVAQGVCRWIFNRESPANMMKAVPRRSVAEGFVRAVRGGTRAFSQTTASRGSAVRACAERSLGGAARQKLAMTVRSLSLTPRVHFATPPLVQGAVRNKPFACTVMVSNTRLPVRFAAISRFATSARAVSGRMISTAAKVVS